jgi:hypothetical protein
MQGKYCHTCGQKQIDPHEHTFKYLVGEFLVSAFSFENKLLKNLWLLFAKPGFLALEYIEGKRKRYMAPFSMFLVVNFFYFIYFPLTDFKLPLVDQYKQPYGALAKSLIDRKLTLENISFDAYAAVYWDWSLTLTKSLIILNVPITAFLLAIWFRKREMHFADHFIYALYLYTFIFLFSILVFLVVPEDAADALVTMAVLVTALVYIFFSIRKVYNPLSTLKTFGNTVAIIPMLIVTHFVYRFILFLTTYAVT